MGLKRKAMNGVRDFSGFPKILFWQVYDKASFEAHVRNCTQIITITYPHFKVNTKLKKYILSMQNASECKSNY